MSLLLLGRQASCKPLLLITKPVLISSRSVPPRTSLFLLSTSSNTFASSLSQHTTLSNTSNSKSVPCQLYSSHRSYSNRASYDIDSRVSRDVVLFKDSNTRYYFYVSLFGGIQFFFWAYLAHWCYKTLRDSQESTDEADVWWRRINFGKNKYRNGLTLLCAAVGYLVLFFTLVYPARAVRQLTLLRGGRSLQLQTFSVLPRFQSLTLPVEELSVLASRHDGTSSIPMKVKGKSFFFLIDPRGKFLDGKLFDFVVGMRRNWRK